MHRFVEDEDGGCVLSELVHPEDADLPDLEPPTEQLTLGFNAPAPVSHSSVRGGAPMGF